MMRTPPSENQLRRGEAATWGARHDTPLVKPKTADVKILRWTSYRNAAGTMLGFVSAKLLSGMIIHELKLMIGPSGKLWIAWPSIKQTNKDGTPKLGPDGKQLWSPIIEFVDKATRDRCGELILEALRHQHPDAPDGAPT
jgi:DNA-binding cell septation regulator SpoVG